MIIYLSLSSESPNWIIYEVETQANNEWSIHRMWPDGQNSQRLTGASREDHLAEVSPDGQWIAVVSFRGDRSELYRFRPNEAEMQQLTRNQSTEQVDYMAWSPDNQWIYYRTISRDGRAKYIMKSDGSGRRQLVEPMPVVIFAASWSPDSEWLVFADGNQRVIYRMRTSDFSVERLTDIEMLSVPSPYNVAEPVQWSPNGVWIAFIATADGENNDALFRMRPDGSDIQRLTDNTTYIGAFNWSPDSTRIAFEGESLNGRGIHVISVDGMHQNLVLSGYDNITPHWSPDGNWLYFEPRVDFQYDFYRIHPDGTDLEQLTSTPTDELMLQFSPQINRPLKQTRLLIVGISLLFIGTLVTQMKGKRP